MGALFFVVIFQILSKKSYEPPQFLYTIIVSLLGGTIGLNIDIDLLRTIPQIIIPVAAITVITISAAFLLAFLIHRLFKKDFLSTILGVIPGGLAVMLLIAESTDCDIVYVSSLQTVRLLTAVIFIPNLLLLTGLI